MIYEVMKNLVLISNAVKIRNDGEFLVVMSPTHSVQYFSQVAKDFFIAIDGTKTIDDIKNYLSKEYDVEDDIIISDLIELVRDLQWKNLILLRSKGEEK